MITQPSIARLLECMKVELTEKIIPGLADPTLVVSVEMMTAVLGALAVRVEHELSWMREESENIDRAAGAMVAAGGPELDALRDALDDYRAQRTDSLLLSHAQGDYDRAGEVLSRLAEAAYSSGDAALISTVEELFEARLAVEQMAIGTFVAVGR